MKKIYRILSIVLIFSMIFPFLSLNSSFSQDNVIVKFNINQKDSSILLRDTEGNFKKNTSTTDNIYKYTLKKGKKYNYNIAAKGYLSKSSTFIPKKNTTINVKLKENKNNLKKINSYWPLFRKNSTNNAVVNTATPRNNLEANVKWTKKISSNNSNYYLSSLIIVDNYIYMTKNSTENSKLLKINKYNGNIIKEVSLYNSGGFTPHIAYGNGMIFVPVGNGQIQAFNAKNMNSLWISEPFDDDQTVTPIYYSDGYIYTGTWPTGGWNPGRFFGIETTDEDTKNSKETKKVAWVDEQENGYYWAGAVSIGNYILYGSDSKIVKAVNKFNGKTLDKINVDGMVRSSITYYKNNIYFTTKDPGFLYKVSFNKSTGKFSNIKKVKTGNMTASTSTPAIYNDIIYIGAGNTGEFKKGSIIAIDANNLKTKYKTNAVSGYPQSSPLITNKYNNTIYSYFTYNNTPGGFITVENNFSSNKSNLKKVHTPSGDMAQFNIRSLISDENGTIYYTNDSGYLFAIENKNNISKKNNNTNNKFKKFDVKIKYPVKIRDNIWGNILGTLNKNHIKTVYGIKKDSKDRSWYKIWYNNRYSYIYAGYTTKSLFDVKIKYPVKIRDNIWGNILGTLNKNHIKTVYGIKKDSKGRLWYKIWYNNKYSYIYAGYTTKK